MNIIWLVHKTNIIWDYYNINYIILVEEISRIDNYTDTRYEKQNQHTQKSRRIE